MMMKAPKNLKYVAVRLRGVKKPRSLKQFLKRTKVEDLLTLANSGIEMAVFIQNNWDEIERHYKQKSRNLVDKEIAKLSRPQGIMIESEFWNFPEENIRHTA